MRLHLHQTDRALGTVLASAVGDALGAGYEFDLVRPGPEGPLMIGGGLGGFEPGEWTDDTAMAVPVLQAAADGLDLRTPTGLDAVARGFAAWARSDPPDMGVQTRRVLRACPPWPTAAQLRAAALDLHERTGRTAGNGSLMRTGPVALAHLDDADACADAARAVSDLTHADPEAGDACVLWSLAIRHAILTGELDVRVGLGHLAAPTSRVWDDRIQAAETSPPATFQPNGWVVTAFQAAWAAISQTPVPTDRPPCEHLGDVLRTAIMIGNDTDTVAAIAGALLGARWGESAVPAAWRRPLHGYPGIRGERLSELAYLAVTGHVPADQWPHAASLGGTVPLAVATLVPHPLDDGVLLADRTRLADLPAGVGAVVSLCQIGRDQVRDGVERVGFRLIDQPGANANLEFVLRDVGRTVAALRDEGKTVLLHCAAAQSRTAAGAIAYAVARGQDPGDATRAVMATLPRPAMNPELAQVVRRLRPDALARRAAD